MPFAQIFGMCGLVKRVKKSTHLDDNSFIDLQPSRSDVGSDNSEECRQNASNNVTETTILSPGPSKQILTGQPNVKQCSWNDFLWMNAPDTMMYARRRNDIMTSSTPQSVHSSPQITPSPTVDVCMADASTSYDVMRDDTAFNDVSMAEDFQYSDLAYSNDVEMVDESVPDTALATVDGVMSGENPVSTCGTFTGGSKATRKQIRQFVIGQMQTGYVGIIVVVYIRIKYVLRVHSFSSFVSKM